MEANYKVVFMAPKQPTTVEWPMPEFVKAHTPWGKGSVAANGDDLKLLMLNDTNFFMETKPWIAKSRESKFNPEIRHFVDSCNGETECICSASQDTQLMQIMNAIYESAETGREVLFD